MARTRRTQTGERAQPISAVPGQTYGAGEDQMAMQRAMPAPQVAGTAVAAQPSGPAASTSAGPPDLAMLMQAAQGLQGQTGLLTQPTNRPGEPITAGLSSGPGVGPSALQMRQGSPAGEMLRRLTDATGDPSFAALARRARA